MESGRSFRNKTSSRSTLLEGTAPLSPFPIFAAWRLVPSRNSPSLPWYCSSVLGYGLVAKRQMKALFLCQLTSLLATLFGAYCLIGVDGLLGACKVVFLTYSVQLVLYLLILWRVRDRAEVFPR